TIIPRKINRWQLIPGRKSHVDGRRRRTTIGKKSFLEKIGVYGADATFHGFRISQFQGPEWNVHNVAAHVAQSPGPVVPPAAPTERHIGFVVISVGRSTEPQLPVYSG